MNAEEVCNFVYYLIDLPQTHIVFIGMWKNQITNKGKSSWSQVEQTTVIVDNAGHYKRKHEA